MFQLFGVRRRPTKGSGLQRSEAVLAVEGLGFKGVFRGAFEFRASGSLELRSFRVPEFRALGFGLGVQSFRAAWMAGFRGWFLKSNALDPLWYNSAFMA